MRGLCTPHVLEQQERILYIYIIYKLNIDIDLYLNIIQLFFDGFNHPLNLNSIYIYRFHSVICHVAAYPHKSGQNLARWAFNFGRKRSTHGLVGTELDRTSGSQPAWMARLARLASPTRTVLGTWRPWHGWYLATVAVTSLEACLAGRACHVTSPTSGWLFWQTRPECILVAQDTMAWHNEAIGQKMSELTEEGESLFLPTSALLFPGVV